MCRGPVSLRPLVPFVDATQATSAVVTVVAGLFAVSARVTRAAVAVRASSRAGLTSQGDWDRNGGVGR